MAFIACCAFVPDGFVSLMELWKVPIPPKIKNVLNEEVGVTKLFIRIIALIINVFVILIIQAYVELDDLRIASSAFCMGWVCYYGISILSQAYHLVLAPHYTKKEESKNRRHKDKQVKKYDLKNMVGQTFTRLLQNNKKKQLLKNKKKQLVRLLKKLLLKK